jgi:hypothetical protein
MSIVTLFAVKYIGQSSMVTGKSYSQDNGRHTVCVVSIV